MNTKLETFNNLDKEVVEKNLEKLELYFEVADAKATYWQNKDDTLVFKLKDPSERPTLTGDAGVELGLLPWRTEADEFNKMVEDYETYYRLWWD